MASVPGRCAGSFKKQGEDQTSGAWGSSRLAAETKWTRRHWTKTLELLTQPVYSPATAGHCRRAGAGGRGAAGLAAVGPEIEQRYARQVTNSNDGRRRRIRAGKCAEEAARLELQLHTASARAIELPEPAAAIGWTDPGLGDRAAFAVKLHRHRPGPEQQVWGGGGTEEAHRQHEL